MADSDSASTTLVGSDDRSDTPQLCQSCKNLDLNIDKFVIGPRTATTSNHPPRPPTDSPRKFHLSGNTSGTLATIKQVQERRNICRLCELTCMAINRYSGWDAVEPSAEIYLTWEVDGRQRAADSDRLINRTRRIRLAWKQRDGKEETVYLVFVAPTSARRLNSDAYASKATDTHFLGRGLFDTREKQALMKSWIDICVQNHGPGCQTRHGKSSEFRQLVESTYFGVIDVIDMQLKPLPIANGVPERYVALSYVWGGGHASSQKPYTTTRTNVMVHIQHGGLEKAWDKLPRTIQDTIVLVSRLGERYLWIDSLCIVQDSNSSWELNAKSMHLVYGNAHFTICAADGNAETGLRAVDKILRNPEHGNNTNSRATAHMPPSQAVRNSTSPPPQQGRARQRASSPFPIGSGSGSGSSQPTTHKTATTRFSAAAHEIRQHRRATDEANLPPLTAECLPGIRLLVSRPTEAVIQDSPWNQRGWTFQERLLSRRCLIFAEGHVYFQCRSTVISQHIFTDGGGANGWSLDWTNSPLRTLGELRRRAFWFYMKCIQLYTGRDLTKPKDVLTAFQGASWLLEEQMKAPLLFGLPSSHFDLALLWMPLRTLDRRRPKTSRHSDGVSGVSSSCTQDAMGNCNCRMESDGFGGKDFPSWSWSGWMGGKADYQLSMVEGCLQNVQEWLRDHTWILWYFRDSEGNLRPLWNNEVLFQDASEEARWRGYAGRTMRSGPTFAGHGRPPPGIHSPPSGNDRRHRNGSYLRPRVGYRRTEKLEAYQTGPVPVYMRPDNPFRPIDDEPDTDPVYQPKVTGPYGSAGWHRSSNTAYLQRLRGGYYDDVAEDDDNEDELGDAGRQSFRPLSNTPGASRARRRRVGYAPEDEDQPSRPLGRPSRIPRPSGIPQAPPSQLPPTSIHEIRRKREAASRLSPTRHHTAPQPPRDFTYFPPRSAAVSLPPLPGRGRRDRSGEYDHYLEELEVDPVDSDDSVTESTNSTVHPERNHHETESHSDGPDGGPVYDAYGRPARPSLVGLDGTKFTGILPDNPFGVIRGPFAADGGNTGGGLRSAMPILQFWTWRTELLVTIRRETQDTWASQLGPGLCRCSVIDKAGDWCGSVVLPVKWISAGREGVPLMFIALSDAKSLTADECPVWNYYIPKEKDESEWDLYFVMIIDRNRERALWERVAIGKVFQAAFGDAVWDEIKLG